MRTEPRCPHETLVILSIADWHGNLDTFPGLLEYIKRVRRGYPHVLFFDAGDTFFGDAVSYFSEARSDIEIMNRFGLDGWVPGNHDLGLAGSTVLELRRREANFPFLAANVRGIDGRELPFLQPWITFEIGGLTITVIGLALDLTWGFAPTYRIGEQVPAAARACREVAAGSDMVIALSHAGFENDCRVAENVPELNLIIGGHDHRRFEELKWINGVPIYQPSCRGRCIGRVEISLADRTIVDYRLVPVGYPPAEHGSRNGILADIEAETVARYDLDRVLGTALTDFRRHRPGDYVKRRFDFETRFGNLVADLIRDYFAADLALLSNSGLGFTMPEGDITFRKLFDTMPYDTVVIMRLTGAEIRRTMEVSLIEPYFSLSISGMRVSCDLDRPHGNRIVAMTAGEKQLEDRREYLVCCNAYLAHGGHVSARTYDFLRDGRGWRDTEISMMEVLFRHLKRTGILEGKLDGRFQEIQR